jgi:error-prone DNA polymerase
MGFYQPAQIVIDAGKHDVVVKPVDINFSQWDNTLEEPAGKYRSMRLGFRQVKGLRQEDMQKLTTGRITPYSSIYQLYDLGLSKAVLEKLADADAFRSLGLDRRLALWEIAASGDRPVGLFSGIPVSNKTEENISLPVMTASEQVVHDYAATSLSLKAHPVSFLREKLDQLHIRSADKLPTLKDGDTVKVAGLVLVRQRPGTAGGVCFITLEDETGYANLVVFQSLFDKFRKEILQSRLLMVEGKLQREGDVIHVIAKQCFDLTRLLRHLTPYEKATPPVLTLSRADEKTSPVSPEERKRRPGGETAQQKIFPAGRNFR